MGKICVKCGNVLEDNAKFCGKCGFPVENEQQETKKSKRKENDASSKKSRKLIIIVSFIMICAIGIVAAKYWVNKKNLIAKYEWTMEPTVKADDIYYVRNTEVNNYALNDLYLQAMSDYAVIQKNGKLGLIDMEGQLKTEIEYDNIVWNSGNYMMKKSGDEDLYCVDDNGKVLQTSEVQTVGDDFIAGYYLEEQKDVWGSEDTAECGGMDFYFSEMRIMPAFENKVSSIDEWEGKSAEIKCNMMSYSTYDGSQDATIEIENYGSERDGVIAVRQEGKWGYWNLNNMVVIPTEYDTTWNKFSSHIEDAMNPSEKIADEKHMYSATEGYIVLRQGKKWELRNVVGEVVISQGIFDQICPVYDGKCWVKKNGKWGIIEIEPDKKEAEYSIDPCGESKNFSYFQIINSKNEKDVIVNMWNQIIRETIERNRTDSSSAENDKSYRYKMTYQEGSIIGISSEKIQSGSIEKRSWIVDLNTGRIVRPEEYFGETKEMWHKKTILNVLRNMYDQSNNYLSESKELVENPIKNRYCYNLTKDGIEIAKRSQRTDESETIAMDTTVTEEDYEKEKAKIFLLSKLDELRNQYYQFNIIDFDNNGIPEIVAIGNSMADGASIYAYVNGSFQQANMLRMDYTYIEGTGLIRNGGGSMDTYYDIIYKVDSEGIHLLERGDYGAKDNAHIELDENLKPIYKYEWDGVELTKEEYQERLKEVYNYDKEIRDETRLGYPRAVQLIKGR